MTATAFLLGSNASMWIPLQVLAPLGDAHSETIATTTVSLGGVTTQHIRAIKRRWALPQQISGDALMAQLTVLREVYLGPFWLYDGLRPNLLSSDRRMMTGWVNNGSGAIPSPSVNLRLTLPAASLTPELFTPVSTAGLIPVKPGDTLTFGVTAAAPAAATLQRGFYFYDAAGAFLSSVASAGTALTVAEARYSYTGKVAASVGFVQPFLYTTSTVVTVTDPTVVPGTVDIGAAWHVVLIDDLTEVHHNLLQHSPTLVLREV